MKKITLMLALFVFIAGSARLSKNPIPPILLTC